jgi:hypothetical protein
MVDPSLSIPYGSTAVLLALGATDHKHGAGRAWMC